ncbi:MAG: peptide chain release factor family protein [Planctomycetota bacterium]
MGQERLPAATGGTRRDTDYLGLDDRALLAQCQVDTYRASGPGGQKRNKTDSAVRLRLREAGLIVTASESRSQHENRARALRRMRRQIAFGLRRGIDLDAYQPSEQLAGCLTRSAQLVVGKRDVRYPPVVGEVLDVVVACDARVSLAAAKIGITTGALTTFLSRDAKLLDQVNRMRRRARLKPIR